MEYEIGVHEAPEHLLIWNDVAVSLGLDQASALGRPLAAGVTDKFVGCAGGTIKTPDVQMSKMATVLVPCPPPEPELPTDPSPSAQVRI